VRLLLDTHILLWWRADSPRLSPAWRAAVADPSHGFFVSVASIWEMAIKLSKGKIELPEDFIDTCQRLGFRLLP